MMMNTIPSHTLMTALTAAAFSFVVGVILLGSAPEEGASPSYSSEVCGEAGECGVSR